MSEAYPLIPTNEHTRPGSNVDSRKTIKIARVEDDRSRQVTFLKRKNGLMKKAMELGILCDCEITVIVFNTDNRKLFEYSSVPMEGALQRYATYNGPCEKRKTDKFFDIAASKTNVNIPLNEPGTAQAALDAAVAATRRPRPFHKFDTDDQHQQEFRINGRRLASSETPPASATAAFVRKRQNPFVADQGYGRQSSVVERPPKTPKTPRSAPLVDRPQAILHPTVALTEPLPKPLPKPLPTPQFLPQVIILASDSDLPTTGTKHFMPPIVLQTPTGLTAFHGPSSLPTFQASLARPPYFGIGPLHPVPQQTSFNVQAREAHVLPQASTKRSHPIVQEQAMLLPQPSQLEGCKEHRRPTLRARALLRKQAQRHQSPPIQRSLYIENVTVPPLWTTNDSEAPAFLVPLCTASSSYNIGSGMAAFNNPSPLANADAQQRADLPDGASSVTPARCRLSKPPTGTFLRSHTEPQSSTVALDAPESVSRPRINAELTETAVTTGLPMGSWEGREALHEQREWRMISEIPIDQALRDETRDEMEIGPAMVRLSSRDQDDWLVPTCTVASHLLSPQLEVEYRPEAMSLSRMPSNFGENGSLSIGTALASFMDNMLAAKEEAENGNEQTSQAAVEGGSFGSRSPRRLPDFGSIGPVVGSASTAGASCRVIDTFDADVSPNDVRSNPGPGTSPAMPSIGPPEKMPADRSALLTKPGVSLARMDSHGNSNGTNSFMSRSPHADTFPLNPRAMDFDTLLSGPPTPWPYTGGENASALAGGISSKRAFG